MVMIHYLNELKTRYHFKDFLFYICLIAVPIVTALLAIAKASLAGALGFTGLFLAMAGLILRFYCTRCPHYTRGERRLKCIFFWGLPKIFSPRPGSLRVVDKITALAASAILLIFPLYWLVREPGLLLIYLLSLAAFGSAIYRIECQRCIFFECPANRVPQSIKKVYVRSDP
jgi:hypothetical protein